MSLIVNRETRVGQNDILNSPISDSTGAVNAEEPEVKMVAKNKRRKLLTLAALALVYFTACAAFSVISPFFPNEVSKKKGCSKVLVGLIFGIYPLTTFIMSPIFGILLPHIGPRFTLFSGLLVEGVTQILFGIIQAIGSAACETACFATIAGEFPDSISAVIGTLETFSGLGMMLGPPLGGVLYQLGGFKLPFLSLGGLVMISLPLVYFTLPAYNSIESKGDQVKKKKGSMLKLLKLPGVSIVALTIFVSGSCLGFLDPTLAPFLKDEYGYNSTKIGLVFLLSCGMYALSAPIFGWLADKKINKRLLMIIGLWLCTLCYIVVGPCPWLVHYLGFPVKATWLMLVGFAGIGLSVTLTLVPVMGDMLNTVREEGFAEDLTTHGLISGIFESMFSIGAFIGPTLGSSLTEKYEFPTAASIFGGMLAVQAVVLTVFTIVKACAKTVQVLKTRRSTTTSIDAPLLTDSIIE